jgi:hypothetical protein
MIDLLTASREVLEEAGFMTGETIINDRSATVFEDATVLGFLFAYSNPRELADAWSRDGAQAIADHQFGLRRAAQKAWNTYLIFIAADAGNYADVAALSRIEEDLAGTRKIARAGVADIRDLRTALLPLLPLQAAPKLEAVDMASEIRQRATELPSRTVDAFLASVDETAVLQVLEEAS